MAQNYELDHIDSGKLKAAIESLAHLVIEDLNEHSRLLTLK